MGCNENMAMSSIKEISLHICIVAFLDSHVLTRKSDTSTVSSRDCDRLSISLVHSWANPP